MLDDVPNLGAARGNTGHRGDMIGLERVLHAQQKPQPQNSEHVFPARLATLYDTGRSICQSKIRA